MLTTCRIYIQHVYRPRQPCVNLTVSNQACLKTRGFRTSFVAQGKPKKRTPNAHLIGTTLKLPAFIKARELSKKLGIDQDRVEKYAREEGLKFRKVSDIILDYTLAAKFVSSFHINPEYEEIDAVRSDYWDCARRQMESPTRPSVIAVMGEIDHGKTSLLDALSNSNVAQFEPGKITQSLSAFTVELDPQANNEAVFNANSNSRVTFLDTPGHGAFENMRVSGASVSDFILLVISAVDGVRPQTVQIMAMAKKYWVPIVVAINKIDIASEDQIKDVYRALRELGVSKVRRSKNPAMQEERFAKLFTDVDDDHPVTAIVEISATKRVNMDILKKVIKLLHSSMEENLHVDPKSNPAEASVIESYSTPGIGKVLLLITHLGTLKVGSHFVTNNCSGVIKSLRIADSRYLSSEAVHSTNTVENSLYASTTPISSESNHYAMPSDRRSAAKEILEGSVGSTVNVQTASAGLPVLISGLKQDYFVPSGAAFFQFDSKERVDEIMNFRETLMEYRQREASGELYVSPKIPTSGDGEDIMAAAEEEELEGMAEKVQKGDWMSDDDIPEERKLNLSAIFKADNQGRLEAVINTARAEAKRHGFEMKILAQGVGDVTTHDLVIAQVEHEENKVPVIPIFLFNVELDANALEWMEKHPKPSAAFEPLRHNIFLNIMKDLKHQIKLKLDRQAKMPPYIPPSANNSSAQSFAKPGGRRSRPEPKKPVMHHNKRTTTTTFKRK